MANVLVVEDSFVMRKKIISVLTHHGHTIIGEAKTGAQAFEKYAQCRPDIVTMDINLPDSFGVKMDGVETVKKIMSEFQEAKIVMISAIGQKSMVLSAIQSGAKNYIVKPFEDDKFIEVINKVLGIRSYKKSVSILDESESIKKINAIIKPEVGMPFSINVKNDIFMIKINKNFDNNCTCFLNTAVQGLLFVEMLNVIVDFDLVEDIEDSVIDDVLELLSLLGQSNGSIRYFSGSEKLIQLINKRKSDIQVHIYTDLDQLSTE